MTKISYFKVGLSSQYKIRRAKRENKVLASKQNLNNESEEGTKITVWKSCQINESIHRTEVLSFFYWLNFAINYLWMCDYKLKMQYVLNSRSYNNIDRQLRVTRRYFIPLPLFEFLSLTFPLNFQLINFPLHERILLYFSCPPPYNVSNGPRPSFIPNSYNTSPILSFLALIY